jgi:hypothetical protein
MNTTELLEAYTKANNSHLQIHRQMHGIKTQLNESIKERSSELRKTVAKIVRGTEWATEEAKYWLSIGHGTQPVTCSIHGHVKLWRGSKERGRCEMEFNFAPAAAAYVITEIRRIVRHGEQSGEP